MENCKLKDNLGIESAAENANVAPLAGSGTDTSATQTTKEANENQLQNTQLQSQLPENGLSSRETMRIDAQNWISDTLELDIFNATGQGLLEEVIEAKFKDAEKNYLITEEIIKMIQNSSTQSYMRIRALVFLRDILQLEHNGKLGKSSKSTAIHKDQLPQMIKVALARVQALSEKKQPSEIEQRELTNDLSLLYEAYTTYLFNESQVQSTLDVLLNVYKQKQVVTPEIAEQIKNFWGKMASFKDIKPTQAGNLSDAIITAMRNKNMQNIDDELSFLESVFTSLYKDNQDLEGMFQKIHSSQRTQEDIDILLATISSLTESLKAKSQSSDIKKGNAPTTDIYQDNDLENIIPALGDDNANIDSQQAIHGSESNTIIVDPNNKYASQIDFIKANDGTITECGSEDHNCFFLSVLMAINGKKGSYEDAENLRIRIKSEVSQKYQDLCRNLPNQIRQFLQEKTEKLIKPLEDIEKNADLSIGNCPINKEKLNDLLKDLEKLLSDINDPNAKNKDSILCTLDESPAFNNLRHITETIEEFKDNWRKKLRENYGENAQDPLSLQYTVHLLENLKHLRSTIQCLNTTRKEMEILNPKEQIDPTGPAGSWVAKHVKKTLAIFPDSLGYEPGECRFFASNGNAGEVKGNSWSEIIQGIRKMIENHNIIIDQSSVIFLYYKGNAENTGNTKGGHYQLVQLH